MKSRNLLIKSLVLVFLFELTGCSYIKSQICEPVITVGEPREERPLLNLADPEPAKMEKVKFIVITEANQAEIFAELKSKGIDPVLIGLTDLGYEAISKNMQNMIILVEKQRNSLKQYKDYYEKKQENK